MKKRTVFLAMAVFFFFLFGIAEAFTFSDDFNDGNADGWISISGYPPGMYGNWRIENGIVVEDIGRDHFIFALRDHSFSDQVVETRVLYHDNGYAGITIWCQDENHSIQIYNRYHGGVAVLEKLPSGETMFEYPNENKTERIWRTMKIIANSSAGEIKVYLDDDYMFTHTVQANAPRSGRSGFNSGNAGGEFDDFKITDSIIPECSAATICGEPCSYGGITYNTVLIGTQCWFRENLNVGTMIGNFETPDNTAPTLNDPNSAQKWCFNDDPIYCVNEGGLYSWAEANGLPDSCNSILLQTPCSVPNNNQGICPSGWHVPSDAELYTLENYLTNPGETCDPDRNGWDCIGAGTKLVLGGSSGFDAIGAGSHETSGENSQFDKREPSINFWSSTPLREGYVYGRSMIYLYTPGDMVIRGLGRGVHGASIRCLANSTSLPTVITLTEFSAKAARDSIVLKWQTESEIDNAGFNVWRSKTKNGKYEMINKSLIPAKGSPTSGASYEFTDETRRRNCWYKLEDIDTNGISTFHGPVKAVPRWFK